MAKVTSKLQVTIPKALAEQYEISPGDEIGWEPAGDVIRVVPGKARRPLDRTLRLRLFDLATERQRRRNRRLARSSAPGGRGWSRAELYERHGRAR